MIIVGQGALAREDGAAIQAMTTKSPKLLVWSTNQGWNGYNVLHTAASRVGGLDLGFVPGEGGLATQDIIAAARYWRR